MRTPGFDSRASINILPGKDITKKEEQGRERGNQNANKNPSSTNHPTPPKKGDRGTNLLSQKIAKAAPIKLSKPMLSYVQTPLFSF